MEQQKDVTQNFFEEIHIWNDAAVNEYITQIMTIFPEKSKDSLIPFTIHFAHQVENFRDNLARKPQPHTEVRKELSSLKNKTEAILKILDPQRKFEGYNTLDVLINQSKLSANDSIDLITDVHKLLNRLDASMLHTSASNVLTDSKKDASIQLYPSKSVKIYQCRFAHNIQRLLKEAFSIDVTTAEKEPFAQLIRLGFESAGYSITRIHEIMSEVISAKEKPCE